MAVETETAGTDSSCASDEEPPPGSFGLFYNQLNQLCNQFYNQLHNQLRNHMRNDVFDNDGFDNDSLNYPR
jgi:hypothetical protein